MGMFFNDEEIGFGIPTGFNEATATEADVLEGKTFYSKYERPRVGTIGRYTGSYSIAPSYLQVTLPTAGKFLENDIIVKVPTASVDPDIKAENIVKTANILGVQGIVDIDMWFSGSGLSSVQIPTTVSYLRRYCFSGMSKSELVIPRNVSSIYQKAFYDAYIYKLKFERSYYSLSGVFEGARISYLIFSSDQTSIPAINDLDRTALQSASSIYVPDYYYQNWRADSNWSILSSKIRKLSEYTG